MIVSNIILGEDGAIGNFMPDLEKFAAGSNGFVLEIGCGIGTGSTHAFYTGLCNHENSLLISVDMYDRLVWQPPVDWWKFVLGDSTSALTLDAVEKIAGNRRPGIIFIDTFHSYEHMFAELNLWHRLANQDTVWLFHDTYMYEKYNHMTDAIKKFASEHGWEYNDFKTEAHGLGKMKFKLK